MKKTPRKSSRQPSLYERLSARLPDAAYTPIPGTGHTSINDAFVRQRLNDVLGPEHWFESDPKIIALEHPCDEQGPIPLLWAATVSLSVTLNHPKLRRIYSGQGGYTNKDKGDAIKGAVTDAFGNALKSLIGGEVYRNEVNAQNMPQVEQYSQPSILGTQHSSVHRFVFHSGVIIQVQVSGDSEAWLNVNGVICKIADYTAMPHAADCGPLKHVSLHGIWVQPKKGFKFLEVTTILQVREYPPIEIPELKK